MAEMDSDESSGSSEDLDTDDSDIDSKDDHDPEINSLGYSLKEAERMSAENVRTGNVRRNHSKNSSGFASTKSRDSNLLNNNGMENNGPSTTTMIAEQNQTGNQNFYELFQSQLLKLTRELETERVIRRRLENKIAKQGRKIRNLKHKDISEIKLPAIIVKLETAESRNNISAIHASFESGSADKLTSMAISTSETNVPSGENISPPKYTFMPERSAETSNSLGRPNGQNRKRNHSSSSVDDDAGFSIGSDDNNREDVSTDKTHEWEHFLHNSGVGWPISSNDCLNNNFTNTNPNLTVNYDHHEDQIAIQNKGKSLGIIYSTDDSIFSTSKAAADVRIGSSGKLKQSGSHLNNVSSVFEDGNFSSEGHFNDNENIRSLRSGTENKTREKKKQKTVLSGKRTEIKSKLEANKKSSAQFTDEFLHEMEGVKIEEFEVGGNLEGSAGLVDDEAKYSSGKVVPTKLLMENVSTKWSYLYGCNLCGLKFSGTEPLLCHRPCRVSVLNKDHFVCTGCRTTFQTIKELEFHINNVHLHLCDDTRSNKYDTSKATPVRIVQFSADCDEEQSKDPVCSEKVCKTLECAIGELNWSSESLLLLHVEEHDHDEAEYDGVRTSLSPSSSQTSKNSTPSKYCKGIRRCKDDKANLKNPKEHKIGNRELDEEKAVKITVEEKTVQIIVDADEAIESPRDADDGLRVAVCDVDGVDQTFSDTRLESLLEGVKTVCVEPSQELNAVVSTHAETNFNKEKSKMVRSELDAESSEDDCCSNISLNFVDDISNEKLIIEGLEVLNNNEKDSLESEIQIRYGCDLKKLERFDRRLYGCGMCEKTYSTMFSLRHHRCAKLESPKKRKFFCGMCNDEFDSVDCIENHLMTVHKELLITCTECKKTYYGQAKLFRRHLREHLTLNLHTCDKCGQGFESAFKLNCHLPCKVGPEGNQCKICLVTFRTAAQLRTHLRVDHGRNSVACEVCRKKFPRNSALLRHMQKHAKDSEKDFSCSHCERRFSTKGTLRRHLLDVLDGPFTCNICNKVTMAKSQFDIHMKSHSRSRSFHSENKLTGDPEFGCTSCCKNFTSQKELDDHLVIHTLVSKGFKCKKCRTKFYTLRLLQEHACQTFSVREEQLTGDPEFGCTSCCKNFTSQKELDDHLVIHMLVSKDFKCNKCRTKFCNLKLLQEHTCQTFSVREEQLKCSECEQPIESMLMLRKHLNQVHAISNNIKCYQCDKQFDQFFLWSRHFREDHSNRRYVCDRCGKSYKSLQHLRNNHWPCFSEPGAKINCHKCGREFPKVSQLHSHLQGCSSRKTIQCSVCPRMLRSEYELKKHMHHHLDEKPYRCSDCDKCFKSREGFLVHMKDHSVVKPFVCDTCSRSFSKLSILQSHMKKSHSKDKPFKCKDCSMAFVYKCFLEGHVTRVHKGLKRRFVCTICNKSFCSKMYLKMHMCSHTGQVPFLCSYCGKGFSARILLKYHLRVHTGEKPYSCKYCFRRFSMPRSMRNHERTHTGEKPFDCNVCGMKFPLSSYLRAHRKKVHADE